MNYPNNPTGTAATEEFFDALIAFAGKHNILIVQDAAYATLIYGREPLSILGRPGGKEVAVELHSMSKSYNMTGWRLGFVAGNAQVVQAFADVKDNIDSGQFKAIQLAACAGIADKQLSEAIKNHYERRLKKLVATLQEVRVRRRDAGRHVLPVCSGAEGRGLDEVRDGGGRVAAPDPRALHFDGAVGRCRRVPALLGDVRVEERRGRRPRAGGTGAKAGGGEAEVLTRH